jgi:hypothetical protein
MKFASTLARVRPLSALTKVAGLLLTLLPLSALALTDGDPLEVYDFSGSVALHDFVRQDRMLVVQHGLWTVQHHVSLDPFGGFWDLRDCTTERILIFYGTRPMWASEPVQYAGISTPGGEGLSEGTPKFDVKRNTLQNEYGEDWSLPATDCTGGDGVTLRLSFYNGGDYSDNRAKLIRLSGNTPATARVEHLWDGQHGEFRDLDGDGDLEIIATDWAHYYREYTPNKGFCATVVLDWEEASQSFVVANEYFFLEPWPYRGSAEEWTAANWKANRRRVVLEAQQAALAAALHSGDDLGFERAEYKRLDAISALALGLTDYLWAGDLQAAKNLFADSSLPSYQRYRADTLVTPEEWWSAYVAGCKKSRYWGGLCDSFPQLLEL